MLKNNQRPLHIPNELARKSMFASMLGIIGWIYVATMVLASFGLVAIYAGIFAGGFYIVHAQRQVVLYWDEEGVWLVSGFFPWNRGVSGVRWRDLDEATYHTGLFAWLTKAYTVRLSHRFTKSTEIRVRFMKNGNRAVEAINRLHASRL